MALESKFWAIILLTERKTLVFLNFTKEDAVFFLQMRRHASMKSLVEIPDFSQLIMTKVIAQDSGLWPLRLKDEQIRIENSLSTVELNFSVLWRSMDCLSWKKASNFERREKIPYFFFSVNLSIFKFGQIGRDVNDGNMDSLVISESGKESLIVFRGLFLSKGVGVSSSYITSSLGTCKSRVVDEIV